MNPPRRSGRKGSDVKGFPQNMSLLTNAWTYDAYDRVASCKDVYGNLMQYKYDLNGDVTNLVYPGAKNVYYAYDRLNHMTNATDWSGRKTSVAYDIAGRMTSVKRPNETVRTLTYDDDGRATSILEGNASGGAIAYYKLGYDEVGRVKTEFAAPVPAPFTEATEGVSYDADNRISVFNGHNVVYDDDGNMTSGPLMNDTPVGCGYDARNRLTSAGGLTYGYDSEGNRTGITQSGQTTSFVIDPTGLPKVLVRIKPDNTRTYYIYGQGLMYQMDDAGNMLTYHADSRGSTVAITHGTGTVTDRVEYNTYGLITSRTGTTDTSFLYNGRFGVMTDPNGLLNMRARFYNPYIKRFLNPDPTGFSGGMNFYAYANGNPISLIDPFGLGFWSVTGHFLEGAAIGAGVAVIVVVAAPEVAAALVVAGLSEAAATATVSGGLYLAGGYGAYNTVVNTSQSAGAATVTGNWDATAFNVGTVVGGTAVGVTPGIVGDSSGGRTLTDNLHDLMGQPPSEAPNT